MKQKNIFYSNLKKKICKSSIFTSSEILTFATLGWLLYLDSLHIFSNLPRKHVQKLLILSYEYIAN